MKVAIVSDTYIPQKNGVVVFLNDFLPRLSEKVEVVVLAPNETSEFKKNQIGNITEYLSPSLPFPLYEGYRMATMHRWQIKKIFEDEEVDVVHLHAPVLLGLKALDVAKSSGLPIVITYHTHFPDYVSHLSKGIIKGRMEEFAKIPVKRLIKTVFSKADIVTVPTIALKRELEDYGLKRVEWVPNGIDFSKFERKTAKVDVRKRYRIPKNAFLILYVGRISFEKKIDVLLSAYKKISAEYENAYLLIAGSGPYLEDYKKIAKAMKLKKAIFAGFVPDEELTNYYKSADVFASASDSETFGLTFVEAMYFGLPVVGVNKLGASDVITKECGLLAEAGNATDFARCLSFLIDHEETRKKLAMGARKKSREYDIKNITEKYYKIYKKIIYKK